MIQYLINLTLISIIYSAPSFAFDCKKCRQECTPEKCKNLAVAKECIDDTCKGATITGQAATNLRSCFETVHKANPGIGRFDPTKAAPVDKPPVSKPPVPPTEQPQSLLEKADEPTLAPAQEEVKEIEEKLEEIKESMRKGKKEEN